MYFHANICVSVHTLHIYTFTYLDIDEYSIGTDDCSQTCTNTDGSFTCGYYSGYILDVDGTSCNAYGM